MNFAAGARERWMVVEIADATGLPIPGFVAYEEDNIPDWIPFCASSDSLPVITGTVTVTLSNIR